MRTTVLVPEALVAAAAIALLLATRLRLRVPFRWLAAAALLVVLAALAVELWQGVQVGSLFNGGWQQDRFAVFAKGALLLALAGLVALVTLTDRRPEQPPEALWLAFLAVFGGMVVASAASLVGLWAGLELAALAGVACAGLTARDTGLRLLGVSALAGGLLAVGFAFLYAVAGASTLSGLRHASLTEPVTLPLALVTLLTLAGIAIRLGLAPFQAPNVEGGIGLQPLGAAVLNGLVAGSAALALAKLLAALSGVSAAWALWVSVLAAFAMVLGGLRAAAGGSLRTLTAWLVVQQVGWVAAGLATHDERGTAAALFLTGALVIAAAACPPLAGGAESGPRGVAGLGRREPARAAALALVLLSLAGVPPLAGFFGQFTVAVELVRSGLGWVLACGLLGSLLATVGVVRALRVLYVEPGLDEVRPSGPRRPPVWAPEALLPALLVLAYGLFANPIHSLAAQGATALGLG